MGSKGDDSVHIYDASRDTTNRESTTPVALHSCGDQRPRQDSIIRRPDGRLDWHIIFVLEGECLAEYSGVLHRLVPNQFILYPPKTRQNYRYPSTIPTYAFWLHFGGTDVPRILSECGLGGGIHHSQHSGELRPLIHALIHEYRLQQPLWEIRGAGILTQLLAELGCSVNPIRRMDDFVTALIERMHTAPASDMDIGAYAAECGFSRSHFDHLFRTQVGVPPHQYLLNLRLKEASWLLRHTDLPVSEIAAQVGFSDSFYFSRLYKKKYNVSPRETRIRLSPTPNNGKELI